MSSSEFLALATLLMAAQAVDGIEEFNRRLKGEPEPRHPRAGYYIGCAVVVIAWAAISVFEKLCE